MVIQGLVQETYCLYLWVGPRTNNGIYVFSSFHDISRLGLGRCRDRDLLRLIILVVVETETHRD